MHKATASQASLEALGEGRFRLQGVLDASTVTSILSQGIDRFQGVSRIDLDLSGVSESDSAGLALLLEWLRLARERRQEIRFSHLPEQLSALARISEVDVLLRGPQDTLPAEPAH